jgi:hypothetical protein
MMEGEKVPGTRMPLANQPPSIPDMVGLMCFIEGLTPGQPINLLSPISYGDCSYVADPNALNLVGAGVTWSGRIWPLLQAHCGGCHGGADPQAQLDLLSTNTHTTLVGPSRQKPLLNFVQPGSPERSYLWLKLTGDGSISGTKMPIDPIGGAGQLPLDAMQDIETWITAGALKD